MSLALNAAEGWRVTHCLGYIDNCIEYYISGKRNIGNRIMEAPNSRLFKRGTSKIYISSSSEFEGHHAINKQSENKKKYQGRISYQQAMDFINAMENICEQTKEIEKHDELVELINDLKHNFRNIEKA